MFTQWNNEWLVLSTASTTSANLQIKTKSGGQWLVNWGDGVIELVNSGTLKSHTYSGAYVGNVLVRPQSGGLNNVDGFQTTDGRWNFDLSIFLKVPNMTYQLILNGNLMTITGNLSSIPSGLTYQLILNGNLMTITGNLSSIPSGLTYQLYLSGNSMNFTGNLSSIPSGLINTLILSGNSMTITGNLSSIPSGLTYQLILVGNSMTITGNLSSIPSGLTYVVFLQGTLMNFTGDIKTSAPLATFFNINSTLSSLSYTSGRVWKNMVNLLIRLASSHLTVTEVNNMLVDLDASPLVTGAGTIDLQGSNGAPTGVGLTAKSSLIAKGKTVYTN